MRFGFKMLVSVPAAALGASPTSPCSRLAPLWLQPLHSEPLLILFLTGIPRPLPVSRIPKAKGKYYTNTGLTRKNDYQVRNKHLTYLLKLVL